MIQEINLNLKKKKKLEIYSTLLLLCFLLTRDEFICTVFMTLSLYMQPTVIWILHLHSASETTEAESAVHEGNSAQQPF